ncbi:hypothetical protein [Streptomyces sp. sk226]|uniref:hypothetical protein n=1 Tax=Streptomyces sp. sk226 TaxID=2034268 RepID=UPI000BF1432B|nr:hypothetical protein [Streptomyces sp. sk226]
MTTAPAAPTTVTNEEAAKARASIADLERTERLVTSVLVVLGIGGLIVTAVNVTQFALDHHVHWTIAWMLDPLVSISLLAGLFIDGKLSAHGYKPGGWPFILRWFAGLTTWLMNCWESLYPDAEFTGWPKNADPAGLLLHSAIPFLVIGLAEAAAGYRRFCTRRKAQYAVTITAYKEQEEARRRTAAAERKRAEEARQATAEEERKRAADLAAEEKRAAIEAEKARSAAEAKAREIRATEEAEARKAERERLDAEARSQREAEARLQQARIDRENAEHQAELDRQRIEAETRAEAARIRAKAEADAAEKEREEKRRAAEARRARTALPAERVLETTALPAAIPRRQVTAELRKPTAIPDQDGTALPAETTAEVDDVRGAEAKRKQIEDATFEAAVLVFMGAAPTRRDFASRYGRGETWGRDRYADAERLMNDDADYAARVLAAAEQRTAATTT